MNWINLAFVLINVKLGEVERESENIKNDVEKVIKKAGYTVSSEEASNVSGFTTGCCSK